MDSSQEDRDIDINFESHPPIIDDSNGITTLLKQNLLHFVDCQSLAKHLIEQKDVTQVVVQGTTEEDSTSDDDEPDNDIYAVSSVINLALGDLSSTDDKFVDCCKNLLNFLKDKCPQLSETIEKQDMLKLGFVVNERYINIPAKLSLPVFKDLAKSIEDQKYTHLVFLSKILLRSRNTNTKLPSKKSKTESRKGQYTEPLVFLNPEEEIICEQSDFYADFDVSAHCDENASWSSSSDIKYIPHRRIIVMDYKNWAKTMECLEKELN